jgi:anti-sigma regulatory factor (Ser/Thr protein kinase)
MPPDPGAAMYVTLSSDMPLDALRARIALFLAGLTQPLLGDVQLVATELVTNSYLHGQPPVRFALFHPAAPSRLRMEVFDRGAALPQVMYPDVHTAHGRGLQLVAAVSRAWGIDPTDTGKTVWVEFHG